MKTIHPENVGSKTCCSIGIMTSFHLLVIESAKGNINYQHLFLLNGAKQNVDMEIIPEFENKLLDEMSPMELQISRNLTWTSSSFLTGIDRTLYFCRSSLDRGADISLRRMCDGAVKCAFLFFRLEAVTNLFNFMVTGF